MPDNQADNQAVNRSGEVGRFEMENLSSPLGYGGVSASKSMSLMTLERPSCSCFSSSRVSAIHTEPQDTECDAWNQLLDLIDRAATSGATEFAPGVELGWESWWHIVTLPPSIAKLTSVKKLMLYGSNLDRIPLEIGEMESLEEFDPCTSY